MRYQTRMTTITEVIEKSSKNDPKINQNLSKIIQKSIKISSWAQRGPKTSQDPSKPENREHFPHPTGYHFGRILEPCWPQDPLECHSQSIQHFHWFGSPSFINFPRFWTGFGRMLAPSWPPKSIKNWIKMLTKFSTILESIFYWFLLEVDPLKTLKIVFSLKRESKNHFFPCFL